MHAVRDFIYVDDVTNALLQIMCKDDLIGLTINIGSGQGVTIGDLAEKVVQVIRRKGEILFDATRIRTESQDIQRLIADISKANRLLEWQPKTTLADGLTKTVEWFASRFDHDYSKR